MIPSRETMRPARCHATLDRGRSRDVSPIAIARLASEERRVDFRTVRPRSWQRHLPQANHISPHPTPTPVPDSPLQEQHASIPAASPSPYAPAVIDQHIELNFAGDATNHHQTMISPAKETRSGISTSCPVPTVRTPSPESYHSPSPPRSLQDQMQEAYALDNMHLARVLYLKLKGIEVTSDDDPRIAEVRDEDFCFVPEGAMALDDECANAIREAEQRERERREHVLKQQKLKEREQLWEEEAQRVRSQKLKTQRAKLDSASIRQVQRHEYKTNSRVQSGGLSPRIDHARRTSLGTRAPETDTRFTYEFMPLTTGSLPDHLTGSVGRKGRFSRSTVPRSPPMGVSFRDVVISMEGRLFPEEASVPSRTQTKAQNDLLKTLLKVIEWEDGERRRIKGKGRQRPVVSSSSTTCIACSLRTASSISRSNSWASSDSMDSVLTTMTSPPTSPYLEKLSLPPLAEDLEFKALVHSCLQKSHFKLVPLSKTPLSIPDSREQRQDRVEGQAYHHVTRTDGQTGAIIHRVRKSVSSLLDMATKVQQSYIRTLQFTMPSPALHNHQKQLSQPHTQRMPSPLKPEGYRAQASDVLKFASPRESDIAPTQVIPLRDPNPPPPPPRVFSAVTYVPPSPLRPRYIPDCPEWRVRPVANPVVLRLRALQNTLCARGMQWEGRAHSGSLGCGREKLTGVAFDGLGPSRLSLESRVETAH